MVDACSTGAFCPIPRPVREKVMAGTMYPKGATPWQEALGYRERLAYENKVRPTECKEAEVAFLPKIGGARTQEEEHIDGVFRYYGRRKMKMFSTDQAPHLYPKPARCIPNPLSTQTLTCSR